MRSVTKRLVFWKKGSRKKTGKGLALSAWCPLGLWWLNILVPFANQEVFNHQGRQVHKEYFQARKSKRYHSGQ